MDLGSSNVLKATLYNFLSTPTTVVKFESLQLGNNVLDKVGTNQFQKALEVPIAPNCYPIVKGNLCVYKNDIMVVETPLSFDTTYEIVYSNQSIVKNSNQAIIQFNASFVTGAGARSLVAGAQAFAEIYKNSTYLETIAFSMQDFLRFTAFSSRYTLINESTYLFKTFLSDGIDPIPRFVNALTMWGNDNPSSQNPSSQNPSSEDPSSEDPGEQPDENDDTPPTDNFREILSILISTISIVITAGVVTRAYFTKKNSKKLNSFLESMKTEKKATINANDNEIGSNVGNKFYQGRENRGDKI